MIVHRCYGPVRHDPQTHARTHVLIVFLIPQTSHPPWTCDHMTGTSPPWPDAPNNKQVTGKLHHTCWNAYQTVCPTGANVISNRSNPETHLRHTCVGRTGLYTKHAQSSNNNVSLQPHTCSRTDIFLLLFSLMPKSENTGRPLSVLNNVGCQCHSYTYCIGINFCGRKFSQNF